MRRAAVAKRRSRWVCRVSVGGCEREGKRVGSGASEVGVGGGSTVCTERKRNSFQRSDIARGNTSLGWIGSLSGASSILRLSVSSANFVIRNSKKGRLLIIN